MLEACTALWRTYLKTHRSFNEAFLPLGIEDRRRFLGYAKDTAASTGAVSLRAMRNPCIHDFSLQAMADLSPPVSPESTTNSSLMDINVKVLKCYHCILFCYGDLSSLDYCFAQCSIVSIYYKCVQIYVCRKQES